MNVYVNGIEWRIKFVSGSDLNLRRDDGTYTIGMTDNRQKSVFLYERLEDALLYKVLCHELVHVFCFSYDVRFSVDTEERLADFIATYGRDILDTTDEVLGYVLRKRIS